MQLSVSGLNAASSKFTHLWGRYILGFKPRKHCLQCFKSKIAPELSPQMSDGVYDLKDDCGDFFYLCGVGQPDSRHRGKDCKREFTNVHLAVRPRIGSVAAIGSVYGVTFTIKDAQAVPIKPLPQNFQNLPEAHWKCKNFQFGYQEYEVNSVRDFDLLDVVYKRRGVPDVA